MTRDEFVEKFKVGDVIETTDLSPITILHIGNERFFGQWMESTCEASVSFFLDWKKVSTPKLPSEDIIQYGRIYSFTGNTTINLRSSAEYANDRIDDILKWIDKNWCKVQMKGEK